LITGTLLDPKRIAMAPIIHFDQKTNRMEPDEFAMMVLSEMTIEEDLSGSGKLDFSDADDGRMVFVQLHQSNSLQVRNPADLCGAHLYGVSDGDNQGLLVYLEHGQTIQLYGDNVLVEISPGDNEPEVTAKVLH